MDGQHAYNCTCILSLCHCFSQHPYLNIAGSAAKFLYQCERRTAHVHPCTNELGQSSTSSNFLQLFSNHGVALLQLDAGSCALSSSSSKCSLLWLASNYTCRLEIAGWLTVKQDYMFILSGASAEKMLYARMNSQNESEACLSEQGAISTRRNRTAAASTTYSQM